MNVNGVYELLGFAELFLAFPLSLLFYRFVLWARRENGQPHRDWFVTVWSWGFVVSQVITLFNSVRPYPVLSWQSAVLLVILVPSFFYVMRTAILYLHETDKARHPQQS